MLSQHYEADEAFYDKHIGDLTEATAETMQQKNLLDPYATGTAMFVHLQSSADDRFLSEQTVYATDAIHKIVDGKVENKFILDLLAGRYH